MSHDERELEEDCRKMLKWSMARIARTRPSDMRAAIEEYRRTTKNNNNNNNINIDIDPADVPRETIVDLEKLLKTAAATDTTTTTTTTTSSPATQPILKSMPLVTPRPSSPVLSIVPGYVPPTPTRNVAKKPVKKKFTIDDAKTVLATADEAKLRTYVNNLLHCRERCIQHKSKLHTIKEDASHDAMDTLVLEEISARSMRRIDQIDGVISFISQQVVASINRKQKLLQLIEEDDDDIDVTDSVIKLRGKIHALQHLHQHIPQSTVATK